MALLAYRRLAVNLWSNPLRNCLNHGINSKTQKLSSFNCSRLLHNHINRDCHHIKLLTSATLCSPDLALTRSYAQSSFLGLFEKGRDLKQLNLAALSILNGIYMEAPQKDIQVYGGLEDSFSIWFTVVVLHTWIVGSRLAREGKDGEKMFHTMLAMMWEDVEGRLKKFEDTLQQNLKVKKRLKDYYRQVNLQFHLLDEGISGSDADLASCIWSILKMKNQDSVQAYHLEVLVYYVRYWCTELDALSMDEIIENPEKIVFSFPDELKEIEKCT